MKKYEVRLIFRELNNYIIDAENPEEAERLARVRYMNGDNGERLGNEWAEVERVEVEALEVTDVD